MVCVFKRGLCIKGSRKSEPVRAGRKKKYSREIIFKSTQKIIGSVARFTLKARFFVIFPVVPLVRFCGALGLAKDYCAND